MCAAIFARTTSDAVKMHTFNTIYKAARNGDVEEQYRLAQMYRLGRMVDVDRKKAVKWFTIAANNGHSLSVHILASMKGM